MEKLVEIIREEAESSLGIVLPFDYEYPVSKVMELVPVAIEAVKAIHKAEIKISAFRDHIIVAPVKPIVKKTTSITLYRSIHNVGFYVYDSSKHLWVNARSHPYSIELLQRAGIVTVMPMFDMEIKDSWGGYGSECGGASYRFRILKNGIVIAEGTAEYNACVPPRGGGYAYTEIRLVTNEPLLVTSIDGDFQLFY
jgi:hypothetical protein